MKTTEGKQYKLHLWGREIIVRPKLEGETFPTHTSHCILFGNTIVTIGGCDKYVCAASMVYEPEKKWKKCPACEQTNWPVWVPLAIESREFFDGEYDKNFIANTEWSVVCRHCGTIVDRTGQYEFYPGQPTEYVYDPSQDEAFLTFSQHIGQQNKRH